MNYIEQYKFDPIDVLDQYLPEEEILELSEKENCYYEKYPSQTINPRTKSPNYFCFAVPDKLADYASSRLQGTPYGVISFIEGEGFNSMRIAKKNMRIHSEDVMQQAIYRILMKGADAHYELFIQKLIKKDLTSETSNGNL